MILRTVLGVLALATLPVCAVPAGELSPVESLGKAIFFDEALSEPPGQSCATCHGPEAGFAGPDSKINAATGVYPGAVPTRFSNRKPPSAAYAGASPILHWNDIDEVFVGGMFFDGRAHGWLLGDPVAEQAQGPFLNPVEQNLPDAAAVIALLRAAPYADRFDQVFGPGALDGEDPQDAFDLAAIAIAAYERSDEVNPFSSKYDFYLMGRADLTAQEQWGLELFDGKGLCAECHPSSPGPLGEPPVFTDFTYDNLGVPRNPRLPFYHLPAEFNPDGADYVDPGLGGFLATTERFADAADDEVGKHKVPTLRNVDARPDADFVKSYMHNGVFTTLEEVVNFYNTRDVGDWPPPEVARHVNKDELGDLKLTAAEEAAIVAFMKTLTDGYDPGPPGAPTMPARTD